jgi:hypothetical protein
MPQYPSKPWQSRSEMLVDQALQSAISDPETIRATRPVVPQQLFPETRGIMKREMSVMDVLTVDRQFPTYRSWISGAPEMFRNGFGVDASAEGSSRYSMQSLSI